MAELLYRLGNHASRHAKGIVVGWLVLLLVAGGAFFAFRGTLTTTFSIPGTPTEEVTDRLAGVMPDAAGGTGTVVLTTEDGSAFTDDQQAAIADAVARAAEVDGVADVIDPFETEAQREAQVAELEGGRAQLDAGRAELEAGRTQLEAGQAELDAGRAELEAGRAELEARRAELDAGRAQLEQARAQAEAAGAIAVVGPQLDAQEAELEAGAAALDAAEAELAAGEEQLAAAEAELEAGMAEIEAGEAQIETQGAALTDGEALLDAAAEVRVVSTDGRTALATVVFTEPLLDVSEESREGAMDAFSELADGGSGIVVDFGADLATGVPEVLGVSEVIGLGIAAIVLLVMLGTFLGAGLPLLTALIGVGVAALASLAFSGIVEMASITPVLGLMLGLAVGIDYSLFIVNRHRAQLKAGYTVTESLGLANGTSGNAVVFAGSTVLIALLALNMTGIPFLGLMGTVAAGFVAIAVAVAITLTPALLSLAGERILSRRERAALAERPAAAAGRPAERTFRPMSTGGAVLRVVGSVVALLVLAIPALDLRIGLPDGSSEAPDTTQYRAFTTIAEEFGAGVNGPLLVVAELPGTESAEEAVTVQADIAEALLAFDDVVAVAPVALAEDRSIAAFQVVPAEGPTAESTELLVEELRAASPFAGGIEIGVAGQASGAIDISDRLDEALPAYLAVVVGLSLIILVVVFRSLLVPLIATGGFILSFFAALGGVVAIYQWGWLGPLFGVDNPGPVLSFLPTLLVGILFGLAMDYMLFIGSGIREAYAHGAAPRVAVVQGLHAGRAVVTAAAIIMASVFGGFIFAHSTMIRPIGFALALGVLLDAFVVRMLLVPGFLHLVGNGAWWLPRWLDRILPDVDVEGSKLERSHPHVDPATTPAPPQDR